MRFHNVFEFNGMNGVIRFKTFLPVSQLYVYIYQYFMFCSSLAHKHHIMMGEAFIESLLQIRCTSDNFFYREIENQGRF
jgi:hypothetical protein